MRVNIVNALSATLLRQSSRDAATVQSHCIGSSGRDWEARDEVGEATTGGGAERGGVCWVATFG